MNNSTSILYSIYPAELQDKHFLYRQSVIWYIELYLWWLLDVPLILLRDDWYCNLQERIIDIGWPSPV